MRTCYFYFLILALTGFCLSGCSDSNDKEVIQWLKNYPFENPHVDTPFEQSPYDSENEWIEAGRKIEGIEKTLIKFAKKGDFDGMNDTLFVYTLGFVGSTDSVQPLIEIIEDPDRNLWTRIRAAMALGQIGDLAAVEPLCKIVSGHEENETLKANAIYVLSMLGDPKAIPVIENALKEQNFRQYYKETAMKKLEELREKEKLKEK